MIFNKKGKQNSTKYTKQNHQLMLSAVTSYSGFLLVILLLFTYLYYSTSNNVRTNYNQNAENTLINNAELFEKDLKIMEVYSRQLLQNDNFRILVNEDNNSQKFLDLGNAVSNSLAIDVYPESLLPIKEVFCYLKDSNYVINPSYFVSGDRFYNWIKRYYADNYVEWINTLSNPSYYYQYLSLDAFAVNSSNSYYMYIMDIDDLYYRKTDAVVCFIFDIKELENRFGCLNGENSSSLLILDPKGHKVLEEGWLYETGLLNEKILLNNSFTDRFYNCDINTDNKELNITIGKYISPETNFQYYYSFPAFETTGLMSNKAIFYIVTVSLVFLSGCWIIFLLSRKNIKPIIELGDQLEDAKVVQTQLQEVVDNQKPIIRRSYVRQLMLGMVSPKDDLSYIMKNLNYSESEMQVFNCLYIVAYNSDNQSPSESTISNDDFNRIIIDSLNEHFGEPFCYFRPAERTYGILVACKESEENSFLFGIHEAFVNVHNKLMDEYGIWIIAGVGKSTNKLVNVWESYQQASEAASYISKNYFFFPYEFIKKDSRAFYYPIEISSKLIHFITTGNTVQVLELFNLIHQENIEERSLPVHILKFLLSDIRNTLLKARFALPDSVDPVEVQNIDERFHEHMTFKLCEDIALSLCSLFSAPSEENNIIQSIEKYIQDNYMDASMGLNKIADEFQISETYFSHLFKEKTGVNFSTYLEKKRMSEAERLIKETDISLNELYISVGYNNANTFRRAFKKIYGITPSAMRDNK